MTSFLLESLDSCTRKESGRTFRHEVEGNGLSDLKIKSEEKHSDPVSSDRHARVDSFVRNVTFRFKLNLFPRV